MSPREQRLVARIGWLKVRERLLVRCCQDYEVEVERLQHEIARLWSREGGAMSRSRRLGGGNGA